MLIKTTPDTEKAKSILKMTENTLELVKGLREEKFATHIIKDNYDILRELTAIIALLDGYKTVGEGAHKELIDYLRTHYKHKIIGNELQLFDELRIIRNKIAYDGFFVTLDYLKRNKESIATIIQKLKELINLKIK